MDLLWIPLGEGRRIVIASGKMFEALSALVHRRRRADLYHSALVVNAPEAAFVIEMAPAFDVPATRRGVVAEGAVGTKSAGRFRIFRYEIRCWRDGIIPDAGAAVSPLHLAVDAACAHRLVDLAALVPAPVWGRDELDAGEMWNSNSVTSWLLTSAGIDTSLIAPPAGGRAPGWHAGIVVARRGME